MFKQSSLPEDHKRIDKDKIGIMIINLGTPDSYGFWAIRRYLKQFLSDRRIIQLNPLIWQLILNFIVLNVRPSKTAHNYKQIWNTETNESPLMYYTRRQAEKLSKAFLEDNYEVCYAMRYGQPSIASQIDYLLTQGCRKIIFIPLYPQYSACTSASISDDIYKKMLKLHYQPQIYILHSYHDHEFYIKAISDSIQNKISELNYAPDSILVLFHGLPQKYFDRGDPYSCYCYKTLRLLREQLPGLNLEIAFQSRFGYEKWLQPYASDKLKELVDSGKKNVLVVSPGFASDCIETLEEINIGYRELFTEYGGEKFEFVPCLNDSDVSIELLKQLCSYALDKI